KSLQVIERNENPERIFQQPGTTVAGYARGAQATRASPRQNRIERRCNMVSMPSGVHKGKPLNEVPDGYLPWYLCEGTDKEWLKNPFLGSAALELLPRGLPYGKYRGLSLQGGRVPSKYLRWVLENVELSPPYPMLIQAVLRDRHGRTASNN